MEVTFGVDGDFIYPFPTFYVLEVNRDETTNEISVVAYDKLYQSTNYTVSNLALPASYNILYFASACAALLGVSVKFENITDISSFLTEFPNGANFDGTEKLREALNAAAEATQTIYYINGEWQLTFKRLDKDGDTLLTINKEQYIDLNSGADCKLGAITHTTELGDSITATGTEEGVTQYLRNNPFLELREDTGALLDKAIAIVNGLTINPFDCSWMGNYLLEVGDKIALIAEDDREIVTYIIDDSITFDGALGQTSRWEFVSDEAETADNPSSLGEALNKTFARVDKINKQIELVVSEQTTYGDRLSTLEVNTQGISATVSEVKESTETAVGAINENFETLSKQVSAKVSAEDVQITIASEMKKGIDKVTTSAGYTFDAEGLTISKSDSEISTQITEDGMAVSKGDEEVLVVNNQGVKAEDLHATTYLIIGNNSRLEDYGYDRTACFWIGG